MRVRKGEGIGDVFGHNPGRRAEASMPLFTASIKAGFPSPADDFVERALDLNEFLVRHPSATFFVRVDGDSMLEAGIHSGDILIVDRAVEPADNKIVIAVLNGELTVKRIRRTRGGGIRLVAENARYAPIDILPEMEFQVWGVVTHVIHSV